MPERKKRMAHGLAANAGLDTGPLALVQTAERLFAEHGIDNVSMRQIVLAAGQGNHYAVQHHFGDKDGLLRAIMRARLPELEAIRARHHRKAERSGPLDFRACLKVLLLPLADYKDTHGRRIYAQFFTRLPPSEKGAEIWLDMKGLAPTAEAMLDQLRQALVHLDDSIFKLRVSLAGAMFLEAVVRRDHLSETPRMSEAEYLDRVIDMCVAALCAPDTRDDRCEGRHIPSRR